MICSKVLLLTNTPLIFCRHVTKKPRISAAHQRNKDEKLMFGGVLETKSDKVKRQKKQTKAGQTLTSVGSAAPDSEAYWLANSSSKELKLFRKTASGRYKEVDNVKLLEKLKSDAEQEKETVLEAVSNNRKKILMPEVIVRRLTTVPMLASSAVPEISIPEGEKWSLPSVTRILSDTMSDSSKAALERWKQQMIAELGNEGFLLLNKEQLSFGARFHACVRRFLEGTEPELDEDLQPVWSSVQEVLKDVTDVQLLEATVVHSKLKYKGVVDCVASYRNTPAVIEWKVSKKAKPLLAYTYDAPVQLSAYLGALSYDSQHRTDLTNGLVVVAYKDGAQADVFPMDEQACLKHWALWLQRLQLYWQSSTAL